jgi:uncharacterized damage-inducible protein DinB
MLADWRRSAGFRSRVSSFTRSPKRPLRRGALGPHAAARSCARRSRGARWQSADELRRDLVEKLQSHHEEIIAVVRRRSEAELRRPPVPGEWSALQQLEHLLLADEIWTGMALRAATEHEPDLAELWAQYRVVEETNPFPPPGDPRTLDELVAALQARHRQTLAIVDATPLDGLSRVGRNTGWGDLTVIQMLRGVYRHYRMHIDQIEEREQSFTPRRVE